MRSNKDIAIKENLLKEKTQNTFFNSVLIDNDEIDNPDTWPCKDPECDYCYQDQLYKKCHIWQGQVDHSGYGDFKVYSRELKKRVSIKAHRFAYAIHFGFDKLPAGVANDNKSLVLNHKCYNRLCVNPYHLEVITGIENVSLIKRKPKK
jgi:hypothetical protein